MNFILNTHNMNHYKTSAGERISKSKIDAEVRKAKARKLAMQLEEHGYNFCEAEGCGRSTGTYLDCAHLESVKSCQENGRSEKAFDVANVKILCRLHHQELDKLYLDF